MKQPTTLSRRSFTTALLATTWGARAQPMPAAARIKIDTERVISDIDPKIYGNFIEHLGRCIEGGVFEEGSPLSDANGLRRDVLNAAKNMHVLGRVKDVAPEPVCIRKRRALFEYAALDAAAEMLDEVAVDLRVNIGDHSLGINLDASGCRHRLGSGAPSGSEQCSCKRAP